MDVDTEWCKFNVIGYTPTVSSGVSFEKIHFDEIIIYGGSGGCDYLQFVQMVWRVRKISSGKMYCYLDPTTNNLPDKLDLVEKALFDSNDCYHMDMFRQIGLNYEPDIDINGRWYYPQKSDPLFRLALNNIVLHNRSENNFAQLFLNEIELLGVSSDPQEQTTDISSDEKKEIKKVHEKQKEIDARIEYKAILQAPQITEEEYKSLKYQSEHDQPLTPEQYHSVTKYVCQETFHKTDVKEIKPEHLQFQAVEQFRKREKYQVGAKISTEQWLQHFHKAIEEEIK